MSTVASVAAAMDANNRRDEAAALRAQFGIVMTSAGATPTSPPGDHPVATKPSLDSMAQWLCQLGFLAAACEGFVFVLQNLAMFSSTGHRFRDGGSNFQRYIQASELLVLLGTGWQ
eukprot:TRINITY_DN13705_c0_g2_i4.p4 TRINITY_DN13705_c0_g2~~TRINITY_DN13705_c0_g2_i4.p4  ORF type:complete len:116 (-),score=14.65 TRINITY_DN13705_c0_g2_i4:366-713(-)